MFTTCTPATTEPVDITATAQAAGPRDGFRVVMTGDAYYRAHAHAEHPGTGEGVRAVIDALTATLTVLIDHDRPLSVGTTWTIRTGGLGHARWTVLLATGTTAPAAATLYITPAA